MRTYSVGIWYIIRLIVENYGQRELLTTASKAFTVQHFTQKLMLSLAASFDDRIAHTKNIPDYLNSPIQL